MKKTEIILLLFGFSGLVMAQNLGQETYRIACQNCHAPRFASAIGAPPAFNRQAWKKRFKQAAKISKQNPSAYKTPMDYLVYNVKMGKNLMQHGGLCQEADTPKKNCSTEAYIAAILYMSGAKPR